MGISCSPNTAGNWVNYRHVAIPPWIDSGLRPGLQRLRLVLVIKQTKGQFRDPPEGQRLLGSG